jgi:cystathionine beta-lyase/cystathionine gamma-synthase
MQGACGLLSFYVRAGNMEQIVRFCESLQHIMMAVSWGGHESLIMPKCASLEPGEFDPFDREHRMLRLYTGLEEPDYLIRDLERAFAKGFGRVA